MAEIVAPGLGDSDMDVVITAWFKKVGDRVTKGEPLFEIASEKLTQEIEATNSGILVSILKEVGETVKVREVIAVIE